MSYDAISVLSIGSFWTLACVLIGVKIGRLTWIQPTEHTPASPPAAAVPDDLNDYFDDQREREDNDISGYKPIGQGKE